MITRNDIAKEAGVSTATVSRVLNQSGYISKEAKKKVLDAVDKLGYKPNQAAKSLVTGKSYKLLFIVPDVNNPYYMEIFNGATKIFDKTDYRLYLIEKNKYEDIKKINLLEYDGFVISVDNLECIDFFEKLKKPCTIMTPGVKNLKRTRKYVMFMENDLEKSLRDLFDIFESKNISGIGMIHRNSSFENVRLKVYKEYFNKIGKKIDENLLIEYEEADYHYNIGYKCMQELLIKNRDIKTVICQNDLVAIGAISAIIKKGLKVPEDISVTGCDDTVCAKFSNPTLTTIKILKQSQGEMIAKQLLDALINQKYVDKIIETKLLLRESFR